MFTQSFVRFTDTHKNAPGATHKLRFSYIRTLVCSHFRPPPPTSPPASLPAAML